MLTPVRILIVEDDAMIAAHISSILPPETYHVVGTALDGESAMVMAEATRPDVAMIDIKLNGTIDGLTVAREMVRRSGTRIVFVTANLDRALLQVQDLKAEYVGKPFVDYEVLDALEKVLEDRAS